VRRTGGLGVWGVGGYGGVMVFKRQIHGRLQRVRVDESTFKILKEEIGERRIKSCGLAGEEQSPDP
jgi:hypothetical protein